MKRVAFGLILAFIGTGCASTTSVVPKPVSNGEKTHHELAPDNIVAASHEDSPATVSNKPWLNAAGGSEFVLTGGQEQFVGVWVEVPETAKRAHVPMSITLTIDTSGSMSGEKIIARSCRRRRPS